MKKQMKQVAAATLAALCFGAVAIPTVASAATINITGTTVAPVSANRFTVYQVFKLTSVDGVQTIDPSSITSAVKAFFTREIPSTDANAIGAQDDADTVAAKIGSYLTDMQKAAAANNDNTDVTIMARKLMRALETANTNKVTVDGTTVTATVADNKLTIDGLDNGYYLVVDETTATDENAVVSSVILDTANTSFDITIKADRPTIDKNIVEDNGLVDVNTAGVGETVTYQIDSAVPDHSYYAAYTFTMNDTICTGLDISESSIDITVNGVDLDLNTDYTVSLTDADGDASGHKESLVIDFLKIKEYDEGDKIVVTYDAVVNEDALIWDTDKAGNPNKVYLTYSSDPNWDSDGDGNPDDENTPDEPTADTPEVEVITYLTQIKIEKYDDGGNLMTDAVLSGDTVGFTLQASDGTKYEIVTDSNGTYTISHSATDATTKVYEGQIVDGIMTFSGLTAGTYTIVETDVPDGYVAAGNKQVTIGFSYDAENSVPVWTYDSNTLAGNEIYTVEIINKKGTTLPSTGGIGTTIFTIVGLTLMATATGAFIIKRKVTAQ